MRSITTTLVTLLLLQFASSISASSSDNEPQSTTCAPDDATCLASAKRLKDSESKFGAVLQAAANLNWGLNYDPQNVFCGAYDCYSILGFDSNNPAGADKKSVSRNYRVISKKFHPDKNGGTKEAKERFVYIAKAQEILTDAKKKAQYDYYRVHSDEYSRKFGATITSKYAPETSVFGVLFFMMVGLSGLTWGTQSNKYWNVANVVIKNAVEIPNGGPEEGAILKARALQLIKECDDYTKNRKGEKPSDTHLAIYNSYKPSSPHLTAKEINKEQTRVLLQKYCTVLVVDLFPDFGVGYRLPKAPDDIFVYKLVMSPVWSSVVLFNFVKFYVRRVRSIPYSDDEISEMTRSAIGGVKFDLMSEEEKEGLIKKELWVDKNLTEFMLANAAEAERAYNKKGR